MNTAMRWLQVLLALAYFAWAAGLYADQEWAKSLWVWPAAPWLNHVFVASIAAAIAAPVLWIGLSGQQGAAQGGALNLTVTSAGSAWSLYSSASFASDPRVANATWVYAGLGVVTLAVLVWSLGFPLSGDRPAPKLVRWSFLVFACVLTVVAWWLIRGEPHVFPWPLKPLHSALYGWIFLGAAIYFLYGFLRPSWRNACGQLLGFLAYDIVLIPPYVAHLDKVLPEHRLSLYVYLAVIGYSALLAAYYLFLHGPTRLLMRARAT